MDVGDHTPRGRRQQSPGDSEEAGSLDAASNSASSPVVSLERRRDWTRRRDPLSPPELDRALVNPTAVFRSPEEVVRHPLLSRDCKREILWRWAWDEYLLDLALADGMPEGEPSQLAEVRAALHLVGEEWRPDPAAPACRVARYEQHVLSLAA
ncbi:MAG: hypothetical protein ABW003_09215 [Microvirga sp.]